ncbi:MAG TPA: NADH-quinone oxidoreductase subunit N [Fimbriimonas sp.]|nr:NADH-quinone oxidoreductase subunit N [Fimbriimonas sp.]
MQAFNFPLPDVNFEAILPVAIVAITGIVALILEMLRPKHNNDLIVAASLAGLLLAGAALCYQFSFGTSDTFAGMYVRDPFGTSMQIVLVASAFLCILFSEAYLRNKRVPFGEFYPLVLWSTVGAMLMASTTNLLMLFLGLEVLSVSLYVMAGMSRKEERSEESAMKYFLLGAFASGFLLFGIAFLYGASGSLQLENVLAAWISHAAEARLLVLFGLGMILVGLGFKSSLVPFHQWTPDVYQGAPTNVAAFMATASKVGALAALLRVLHAASFEQIREQWMPMMIGVAILTILVGNLVALTQKDIKRILAYSSIAHAGYVLVAILAYAGGSSRMGSGTVSYYLFSYAFMTIGAFAVISLAAKDGKEPTTLNDLHGLYRRSPIAAVALVVCMLSLIGMPPTAGFIGKLMIFNDAVSSGLTPLAIVLALGSAISIYYYLGIAIAACTGDGAIESKYERPSASVVAVCAVCVVGILALSLAATPLLNAFSDSSAKAFTKNPRGG